MATTKVSVKKATLLEWYRQIVLIRKFENKCDELYRQKRITGVYLHLYSGHEAIGVGALAALRPDDHVITAYRDHGIALARGVDPKLLMAEMMGRRTGVSGGKGGSMHLASREHNFWGGYAIVGGHLPLAAGIALESRYNNKEDVVISFVGDGATNNGYFHESVNLTAVWDLPVVWIIENNLYGMGTPVHVASGEPELYKKAHAYGVKTLGRIDGQNVLEVYEAVSEAVEFARKTGPVLIEAITFRYKGHGVSDRAYEKREEELSEWHSRDPIGILRTILTDQYKHVDAELAKIEQEADEIVEASVKFADESPLPTFDDLLSHVYVEE
jgi:pyruvate dehydrogenase E1 component alpha subunit